MALEKLTSVRDTIEQAKAAEAANDPTTAITLYQQALQMDTLQEYPYDRLMILYRKQKDYKNELRIIRSGIKAFQNFYKTQTHTGSRKVAEISKKLSRSFGLIDKKGNAVYEPKPIPGWKKRIEVVEKRLKKKTNK